MRELVQLGELGETPELVQPEAQGVVQKQSSCLQVAMLLLPQAQQAVGARQDYSLSQALLVSQQQT
jgi:hypothetical protein